jgi:hypothetical protein
VPLLRQAHTGLRHAYLLKLKNGETANPSVLVSDRASWQPGDSFAARDGSQWRIVSVDAAPPLLAEEGFEATWVVEPLD